MNIRTATYSGPDRRILHRLATEMEDAKWARERANTAGVETPATCSACKEAFRPNQQRAEIAYRTEPNGPHHLVHADTCFDSNTMNLA